MKKDKENTVMDLNCIRLTPKAIEVINELQAGGTLLTKLHTNEDFTDSGIDDAIKTINELLDFIFSMYTWKMNDLDKTGKVDFAFELLENIHRASYIKYFFDSLRACPECDMFERKPETK
jgi:hypothetical protein